jgi:hypothetical protein
MNPRKPLTQARYGFAGVMRARERGWLGFPAGDPTQFLFNTQGRKVHSLAAPSMMLVSRHALAMGDHRVVYSPPGLERDLTFEAGRGTPFVLRLSRPFDLTKPADWPVARLKAQVSLSGQRAYLSILTRHFLCPAVQQPVPFVIELELFTMFLENTAAGPVQRSIFTRTYVDPETNEPTDIARDRITGRHVPVGDTSVWRVNKAGLLNPRRRWVDAHYSFAALLRASYMPWTGYAKNDSTQVLVSKAGIKVSALERFPLAVRRHLVERYPQRV